jgi:hypothetical protein
MEVYFKVCWGKNALANYDSSDHKPVVKIEVIEGAVGAK